MHDDLDKEAPDSLPPDIRAALEAQSYLRRKGFRSLARRVSIRIARQFGWDISYQAWVWSHSPSRSELSAQRRWARTTPGLPHFTLMIRPTGKLLEEPLDAP